MNFKILQKCVDTLNGEEPDLSYIRGMLEVLLAMEDKLPSNIKNVDNPNTMTGMVKPTDEAPILDAKARAAIKTVQELSNIDG